MKNKLIVLSLYLITVFSCQGNNVIEPVKSIAPTPRQSIINVTPSPSIISSPSILSTPSLTTPSPSEMPITIDQAMIDYPDDYNQEESPKVIYSLKPISGQDNLKLIDEEGIVYDRNNNPVADADITISSPLARNKAESEYFNYFYYKTKTDEKGHYKFSAYDVTRINIFVSKTGFTTRKKFELVNLIGEEGGTYKYDFGKSFDEYFGDSTIPNDRIFLSINNEPEITEIVINNQQVKQYNLNKISSGMFFSIYKRYFLGVIIPDVEFSKFKVKSIGRLEVEVIFNKSIIKESVENNIEIKSLDGVDVYNKSTKDINFNWTDNNSKLNVIIPITKYNIDKKYKLGFKNPFFDSEKHQSYSGMYISLSSLYRNNTYSELSENIVFSIAGNKGN